ncbi:hypothetical protein ACV56Z_04605 [Staphylococcus aureus]
MFIQLHDENMRQLVSYDGKHFKLNKTDKTYIKEEIVQTLWKHD